MGRFCDFCKRKKPVKEIELYEITQEVCVDCERYVLRLKEKIKSYIEDEIVKLVTFCRITNNPYNEGL